MLTPEEILNRSFPDETDPSEPDLLGGYPDFSYGAATQYFAGLTPEERALVHHYEEYGIMPPFGVETYATDFARSYTVVDPYRASVEGVHSAIAELDHLQNYLDVFLASDDYFPRLGQGNISVFDETGHRTGDIDMLGWQSYTPNSLHLARLRQEAERTKILMGMIRNFIHDPTHDELGLFTPQKIREHVEFQRTDTDE